MFEVYLFYLHGLVLCSRFLLVFLSFRPCAANFSVEKFAAQKKDIFRIAAEF